MKLENGRRLPNLTIQTLEDGELRLPADVDEGWVAILFYRGHW